MTKCNIALRNCILSVCVRESKTWVCLQISFYSVFCNVIKFIHFPILNMKEITAAALDSRHNLILGSLYIFCRILVLSTADFVLKLVSHIIVNTDRWVRRRRQIFEWINIFLFIIISLLQSFSCVKPPVVNSGNSIDDDDSLTVPYRISCLILHF